MATASSSRFNSSKNIEQKYMYDVYISFRGEDTRESFTSHLHAALERKNIKTFIDYQLKKGGEISIALENAIEQSEFFIVVFSKNYASSTWCLNELVKIIDCKKSRSRMNSELVIPIFYKITPSEVRKQSGSFKDAFSKHQRSEKKDKVHSWRAALIDTAALAGWDSSVIRPDSVLVDEVVKDVLKKLRYDSIPYNIEGLVGIDSRVKQIQSLLNIDGFSDVCSIGIWGMAGIGKTTIAQVLYNQFSHQFEGCCFLEKVKDKSSKHDGLYSLKKKLLSKLLDEDGIHLETLKTQCTYNKCRLLRRKVFIVLDDINDPEQFETLVGALDGFGAGSRIIVTSRDRQVLINCGVDKDKIYQLLELDHLEALELFYWHAFKKNRPPCDILELLDAVVNYAGGIPLALKVLGSSLQNKSSRYWKEVLKKLKQVPNPKIYYVLKISYDGLDDEQKSIFLDIVCFFNGDDRDHIIEILASSYWSIYCGIEDLIDKSLITLSDNSILSSHDLLQEMGWKIVRDESSEPGKRSRLFTCEDVYHVLKENSGTELIEGIFLDISKVGKMHLRSTVLSKMHNLRLLKFFRSGKGKDPKLHLPENGLESFPSELRYLYWEGYPLRSLPLNFNLKKLVEFSMPHSNLEELWDGSMDLVNLKKINLSYSKISNAIIILPEVRCLTDLNLSGSPIQEIPASIGSLKKLCCLTLDNCKALKNLPSNIHELDSLENLNLSGCTSLTKFPEVPENIRELALCETAIEEVPSSVGCLSKLVALDMDNCRNIKRLPSSICKITSLESLSLKFCSNLESFPEISGNMENLFELSLDGTAIKELPPSIENIVGLSVLHLSKANNLSKLPATFQLSSLVSVYLRKCPALTNLFDNFEDSNSEVFSFLSSVRSLHLSENNFERLPNLEQLSKLVTLDICYCKRLKSLPKLPPLLRRLDAHDCTSLERIENFHFHWSQEYSFRFSNCFKLVQYGSIDDIVANAHLNIQLMAAVVAERFNHHQVLPRNGSVSLVLPTSKIPACFNNRSIGSSIAVPMSPAKQNSLFLGFAFCIVVEFDSYHTAFWGIEVDCYFKSSQGCGRGFRFSSSHDWIWESAPVSDHLFVLYDHEVHAKLVEGNIGDFNIQNSLIETLFQFRLVSTAYGVSTKYAKVKECGIHLLYKYTEECPQKILTSNDGQSSRILSIEDKVDPQSKRFEKTSLSKMHHNLDLCGQIVEEDDGDTSNDRGCKDNYCYNETESSTSFGSFSSEEEQESKKIVREFNLWDWMVRFLHFCDMRNCL